MTSSLNYRSFIRVLQLCFLEGLNITIFIVVSVTPRLILTLKSSEK